jgi:8-oxo-dGTP diphosphatase
VTVYLIRHAHAGSRRAWDGADADRPLSERGDEQAKAIAAQLGDRPIKRVLASASRRCLQTVTPLADAHQLAVEPDSRLFEGSSFEPVLELLTELPDDSALCSHGDVIPDVINALMRRGLVIEGPADTRKGARWEIERVTDGPWRARAVAPPDRPALEN